MQSDCDNETAEHLTEQENVAVVHDGRDLLPWLAALASARIRYTVEPYEGGWAVLVQSRRAADARRELGEYERLNRDWPPAHEPSAEMPAASSATIIASLLIALGLVYIYRLTGEYDRSYGAFAVGVADSGRLLGGEWWRAVTALFLHADLTHVLGNAVCCLLFGIALGARLGPGLSWALVLLSGTAGNAVAALLIGPGRAALGASTATLGALGCLGALQAVRHFRHTHRPCGPWNRSWIPLAAAAAALALLGSRPGSDLAGHFCGFAAGLVFGMAVSPVDEVRVPPWLQALLGILAAAVVAAAWWAAFLGVPPA